jgi:hypothetical protein
MENMKNDNKDKIPEDEMTKIDELLTEAKALKDKEDVTKEELDTEIEKFSKEFETYGQIRSSQQLCQPKFIWRHRRRKQK